MENTISKTNFNFKNQTSHYTGKVREVYFLKDKLIMVATDRISAFDHVLHEAIPYKGQVLNQMSSYFLNKTSDIVPNWLEEVPDPNISVGKLCEPIRLEMVIRGYLTGHAWRVYKTGERYICGERMPENMKENEKFPSPIITPTYKALEGHDEDVSKEEILKNKIVTEEQYKILEDYTFKLFERGSQMAAERDLILVDTKYEFGIFEGKIILIDEVHTPDSSRYFYQSGYEERQNNNEPQIQLSKEFVREWLIKAGFQGKEGQEIPHLTRDVIETISEKYIELYERMTGLVFKRAFAPDFEERIKINLKKYFN